MRPHLHEVKESKLHYPLCEHRIVPIDVPEPQEYVNRRIDGALLFPLFAFNPMALPVSERPVVLPCGSGKRSTMAMAKCIAAGVPVTGHLKGRFLAWKHARFPIVALDPGGGTMVDRE